MLLSLLLMCAVLGTVRCGLTSLPSDSETQTGVTLEQVTSELARIVESSVSSATAAYLRQIADQLGGLQRDVAAVSTRLDSITGSQTRLEEAHNALVSRLDSWQQSKAEILGLLASVRDSHEAFPDAPSPRSDAVNASQGASSDSVVSESDREAGESSSEEDGAGEPLSVVAVTTTESAAARPVLGQWCEADSDCTPLQPETECGERRVCSCRPGYRQVSGTECRRRSGLLESCTEDADCKTADSSCTGGVCNCTGIFWNYNNQNCRRRSLALEGRACIGDLDCDVQAGLECLSEVCKCKAAVHGQYEFRVAGGGSCSKGRVELRLAGGPWGFVCDDSWGSIDAGVFCRSLGFKSGQAFSGSKYGRGKNFFMDEVQCEGSERHLLRCTYNGWGRHNCNAGEVSSVACSNT